MQVVINQQALENDNRTRGVGAYARELLISLRRLYPQDQFISVDSHHYPSGLDLVHFPFFDLFFPTLPLQKKHPTVVTIHDLIPLNYPRHFPAGIKGRFQLLRQRYSLRSAAHLITDSVSSRADLLRHFHSDPAKISVIPLAPATSRSSLTLAPKVSALYRLPARYLLYVGDINWNKNVPGLIRAFGELKNPRLHLVLVGKVYADQPNIPEYRALTQAINDSGKPNKIHLLGYVPQHHLPLIYQLATLYIQPSFAEGFGFPVLEAMKESCPVLSSNQGSLPEVGGKAVAYFNPHKRGDLKRQLRSLLASSSRRRNLVARGKEQLKNFSWKQTARLTYAVYEKVLAASAR